MRWAHWAQVRILLSPLNKEKYQFKESKNTLLLVSIEVGSDKCILWVACAKEGCAS